VTLLLVRGSAAIICPGGRGVEAGLDNDDRSEHSYSPVAQTAEEWYRLGQEAPKREDCAAVRSSMERAIALDSLPGDLWPVIALNKRADPVADFYITADRPEGPPPDRSPRIGGSHVSDGGDAGEDAALVHRRVQA
jgi:hypothetical protein